jgi:hypothetical protein
MVPIFLIITNSHIILTASACEYLDTPPKVACIAEAMDLYICAGDRYEVRDNKVKIPNLKALILKPGEYAYVHVSIGDRPAIKICRCLAYVISEPTNLRRCHCSSKPHPRRLRRS